MRVLSLFDGIGCAAMALRHAGIDDFEVVAVENDPAPRAVADAHCAADRPAHDVRDIAAAKKVGKVDVLVAGFPCQSFSKNGRRDGLASEGGALYQDMLCWRDICRPDVWLFENVPPIGQTGSVLNRAIGAGFRLVNSKAYGAQYRKRAFWCSHDFSPKERRSNIVIEDVIDGGDGAKEYDYTAIIPTGKEVRFVGVTKYNLNWQVGKRSNFHRLVDGRKIAVSSSEFVVSRMGKIGSICTNCTQRIPVSPSRCRKLSVVERARFQHIPDRYVQDVVAAGKISHTRILRAIGNAFDVAVVGDIFRQTLQKGAKHEQDTMDRADMESGGRLHQSVAGVQKLLCR